jgi:SAM-dependent methyltransferase
MEIMNSDGKELATSFGNVADSYDRFRPGPAPAAVEWLLPAGCAVAVDLAAGTGLFTRAIEGRAAEVVAIEPDERMRDVLAARSPGVRVLDGRAEQIPLPDASADAVFVSAAWHWFNPKRAVPEIARVLRDGGRLGVLQTTRDLEQDWVAELEKHLVSRESGTTLNLREQHGRRRFTVMLPPGGPFGPVERASFGSARTLTVDDTLQWLGTRSDFIAAEAAHREAALARLRAALLARSGGAELIEMPTRSWCWRADRLPRSAG